MNATARDEPFIDALMRYFGLRYRFDEGRPVALNNRAFDDEVALIANPFSFAITMGAWNVIHANAMRCWPRCPTAGGLLPRRRSANLRSARSHA